jgi:hypothetical protein
MYSGSCEGVIDTAIPRLPPMPSGCGENLPVYSKQVVLPLQKEGGRKKPMQKP